MKRIKVEQSTMSPSLQWLIDCAAIMKKATSLVVTREANSPNRWNNQFKRVTVSFNNGFIESIRR